MASSDSRQGQCCTRCMKPYTDPEARCGDGPCQTCLDCEHDEQRNVSGAYVAPEGRIQLLQQPAIGKDTTWDTEAQKNGTYCTYCIYSSVPAMKYCLNCDASLCDDHLKAHNKSPEHVLTETPTSQENKKCSIHKKILEYYCHEEDVCICVYCLAEKHRLHQLEPLDKAIIDKKNKLKDLLETLVLESDLLEEAYQRIIKNRINISKKVSDIKERVAVLFLDIRKQLEDLESKVLHEVSRQEAATILSGDVQMERLQIKKNQLSGKMRLIKDLCEENDPMVVFQCGEDQLYDQSEDLKEEDKKIHMSEDLNEFLIALTVHNGLNNIATNMTDLSIPEAKDLLLDLNTAANNVLVSSDLKNASWSVLNQRRKETERRFGKNQVLSTRGFSAGQHYWEVETSESEYWMVGVTYPSTDPKSPESWIGNNPKSWCFCRWHSEYSIRHGNKDYDRISELSANRLGIYLDYEGGQVSFYELSDPIRHLYTFSGTFTEPLHAAFWVEDNGWLNIRS